MNAAFYWPPGIAVRTCSCKVWTMASKVTIRASNTRMYAWTAGGVRSQSSGGKEGCVSMATGYAIRRRERKRYVLIT